ncbi:ATP-binding protein [Pedomonas sp. V897]|uniref:sensor histidine kinase n=1 Tax=Pedomonas sp. V897 TaxID=3446482 RepID=UPI003EDF2B32
MRLIRALEERLRLHGLALSMAALLTTLLLWGQLPFHLEAVWLGLHSLLWAGIFLDVFRRQRRRSGGPYPAGLPASIWVTAGTNGLLWGLTATFILWLPQQHGIFLEVVNAAICAGAAAMLTPAPRAARAFIGGIALPFIVLFLWQGDSAGLLLALATLLFALAMVLANHAGHMLLREGLEAQEAADRAIADLRAAQQNWRELSETAEAFALFDDDHSLVLWNDVYARVLGLTPDALFPGMSWRQIEAASGLPGLPEAEFFGSDRISGKAPSYRCERQLGDRWYRSTIQLLANGRVAVTHVDISALKQREAELLRLQEELEASRDGAEAASQAKSRFLANMSHELRTPLNAVIGFSDLLTQDLEAGRVDPGIHSQYARTVLESGHHLLAIVEDMLDLARIEAGKLRVTESQVDLVALVRSAGAMARGRGTSNSASLREILLDAPLLARIDARLTRQALINLIANALKFSRPDGLVTVRLDVEADGTIRIDVEDEGIGIPPHMIEEVMKPFAQVEESETRRYGGIGLGLPLARQFIELQGGQLELQSHVGEGTRATIRLPAARRVGAWASGAQDMRQSSA